MSEFKIGDRVVWRVGVEEGWHNWKTGGVVVGPRTVSLVPTGDYQVRVRWDDYYSDYYSPSDHHYENKDSLVLVPATKYSYDTVDGANRPTNHPLYTTEELQAAQDKALEEFKRELVMKTLARAEEHGHCDDVEEYLAAVGLNPQDYYEEKSVTFTVKITAKASVSPRGFREDHAWEFFQGMLSSGAVSRRRSGRLPELPGEWTGEEVVVAED